MKIFGRHILIARQPSTIDLMDAFNKVIGPLTKRVESCESGYAINRKDINCNSDSIIEIDKDLADLEKAVQFIIHNEGIKDKIYAGRESKKV